MWTITKFSAMLGLGQSTAFYDPAFLLTVQLE